MSFRTTMVATATTVTLVGGIVAATTVPAPAAPARNLGTASLATVLAADGQKF